MSFTKEELHEIEVMADEKSARIVAGFVNLLNSLSSDKTRGDEFMKKTNLVDIVVKELDMFRTISAKASKGVK